MTLDPAFAPGTLTYAVAVGNAVDEVTVTPTTTDTNATPEFLTASDATLDDADTVKDDFQVALAVGDTVFKVQVTAEDTTTTQTYTVTVTRAAADTPTVTIAADQPAFTGRLDWVTFTLTRTGNTAAALDVAVALTQDRNLLESEDLAQTVTFGAGDATAALILFPFVSFQTVTQETTLTATVQAGSGYAPGSPTTASTRIVAADPAVTASIEEAAYTFAEDATVATVAVILRTATGVPSPNTDILVVLSTEEIPGQAVSNVDYTHFSLFLTFQPSDFTSDGAAFTARQEVTLAIVDDLFEEPDETLTLALEPSPGTPEVVALRQADGTACQTSIRCDVTVTITDNDGSTDATLSRLSLGTGVTLDPTFAPGTLTYTAVVGNAVDEVTVTATTTDTNATPEFLNASDATLADADGVANGHQVALAVGDNVFKVQVTAEDGTTTQTYTVTVTRAAADTPTCTLNTGDIWCGVVTPASHLVNGVAFAHGFVDDTPDTGALSDKEFSVVTDGVTNSYTIVAVALGVGNATGSLSFSLTSALTAADAAKLVLHVDGSSDQFAFSVSGNPYVWPRTDLDWSSGDPVTLRLRDTAAATPPDAPTGFTATVGDAQVALAWKAARLYSGVTGHEFWYKTDGDYPEDWTAIAYSGPDEANENAFTVTGLTNEVAHTFELRAVNAAGGGDAATAEPVTPTPGICDHTQKIQDAILAELSGVDDCAAVTVANLASITTFGSFGFGTFNQGITSLQKGDFAGLTSLTILNLGNNGLTSLPEGIFSGLAELANLNLSNNQLESLPEGVFDGLVKLDQISLSSNLLTGVPEGAFSGLTALQILFMSNNNLSSLPEDLFSGLTALYILGLNENDLSSLPEDLFSGLTALDTLYLQENALDSLPGTVFSGLTALTRLELNNNALDSLPEGLFSGLTALTRLELRNNALESLPEGLFSDLTALTFLELRNNALESLPEGLFSGLTALTRLELRNNALESLPEGLFSDLTALTSLQLNNNALESLPEGLFSGLTALKDLALGGNSTNPMELTVTVEKVGTNQVRAKVLAGAPFAVDIPVTLVDGTLAGSVTELGVAAGAVDGTAVTVTRTAGTTAAVTVDVDLTTQPTLPSGHKGYIFKKASTNLPATILPDATLSALSLCQGRRDFVPRGRSKTVPLQPFGSSLL